MGSTHDISLSCLVVDLNVLLVLSMWFVLFYPACIALFLLSSFREGQDAGALVHCGCKMCKHFTFTVHHSASILPLPDCSIIRTDR